MAKDFHEKAVPWLFVVLWIAGLILTIIHPDFLFMRENKDLKMASIVNSLICVYLVFVVEFYVAFKDIQLLYRVKEAKKQLQSFTLKLVFPNILLTFFVVYWYSLHDNGFLLFLFIALSAILKYWEVWLANNGDRVFGKIEVIKPKSNQ